MIRVLIVDDHTSFRNALAFMIARAEGIAIAGEAGTIEEARDVLARGPVDVALVDLDLGGEDGTDLIAIIREQHPEAVAIVLSGSMQPRSRALAVAAGAIGTLHKSASVADIVDAITRAAAGEALISPMEAVTLMRQAAMLQARTAEGLRAIEQLTPREADVLRALAAGLDNHAIAERLYISHETVRSHVVGILRKLGVESRLQAVLFALRHGFIEANDLE